MAKRSEKRVRPLRKAEQLYVDLPGFKEGFKAGHRPDAEKDVDHFDDLAATARAEAVGALAVEAADLEARLKQARESEAEKAAVLSAAGEAEFSRAGSLMLVLAAVGFSAGDAWLLCRVAVFNGIADPVGQWVIALGLTLGVALGLEGLATVWPSARRILHCAFAAAVIVAMPTIAVMRVADLQVQADESSDAWARMISDSAWLSQLATLSIGLLLVTAAALVFGLARKSLRVHRCTRRLDAARGPREVLEQEQAALVAEQERRREWFDAAIRAKRAEYLAGINAFRAQPAAAPSRFQFPWPARIGVATGLLVLVLVFTSGCNVASAFRHRQQWVVLLDPSPSVVLTDDDAARALDSILARVDSCTDVVVAPVNARAGSTYVITLPCEPPLYNTGVPAAVRLARANLPERVRAWRAQPGSDYQGAFRLAVERFEGTGGRRVLIVLGDLEDASIRARPRARGDDLMPGLGTLRLTGAEVYVGLLPTAGTGRADRDAQAFTVAWSNQFAKWGVSRDKLTMRVFGIQGLDTWAEQALGPTTAAWTRWAKSNFAPPPVRPISGRVTSPKSIRQGADSVSANGGGQ